MKGVATSSVWKRRKPFHATWTAVKMQAFCEQVFAEANGWDSRDKVIAAVYQQKFDLASLAPFVLKAAGENDQVALAILRRAATHLAGQLKTMVRAMGSQSKVGVVFVGGLIDHDTVYARLLRETITELVPSAEVRPAAPSARRWCRSRGSFPSAKELNVPPENVKHHHPVCFSWHCWVWPAVPRR